MISIDIRTNFPQVQAAIKGLREDVANRAQASALNRVVAQAKTAMSREIRAEFNVTPQQVNEQLAITRARAYNGTVELRASLVARSRKGRSLNLIRFVERSITLAQYRKRVKAGEGGSYQLRGATRSKQLELRFRIKKGGPAVTVKGAFIGNKGRTVFIREGKSRVPIKAVQTIDISQMFNTKRINAKVVQLINAKYPEIATREIKFFTDKFNRS